MTSAARLLLLAAIVFTGCARTRQAAREVAVTTFRVIDAPANYVRRKIDEEDGATTTTSTTTETTVGTSDVVTPGRPVEPRRQVGPAPRTSAGGAVAGATPRPPRRDPAATANATPPPQRPAPPATTDFPTARPVPGKPGFVYSVDPSGGIVDVTGYKSGDKAKDPYTQKIFIVP